MKQRVVVVGSHVERSGEDREVEEPLTEQREIGGASHGFVTAGWPVTPSGLDEYGMATRIQVDPKLRRLYV
ncbi:MAG: hypothetical protein AB1792_10525 [Candidatus Zixiibacteriota bacterium]